MKRIVSEQNPAYKDLIRLKQRKTREREGLFLAEGFHLTEEAERCGLTIRQIYADDDLLESGREGGETLRAFLEEKEKQGCLITLLAGSLFAKVAETETPQGVIALVEKPVWEADAVLGTPGDGRNLLVLDRIQDPGNLGTLIRTADCAGYSGAVLLKGTADPYNPKTLRAAAGSLFRVPCIQLSGPEETLQLLRQAGKEVLVTSPRADQSCYDVPMKENIALVIGNEGAGACDELLDGADRLVKIPMDGDAESLNAAVAAAILLYETVRQRYSK